MPNGRPHGTPQAGDHFGATIEDSGVLAGIILLIGAPDDVTYSEGVVHGIPMAYFRGETVTPSTWIPGQDGIPTGGARFGASID
jgi:hypothetical protein